jgi:hypothetical protein
MIADFVPARTSLSTGVTINSPVLERNKVSYAEPLVNNQFVYDADYNDNTRISPQYGQLYDNLTGSKAAFFTGELSGSGIDIYNNYFEPANSNYYLHPTSSLTTNDLDIFNHSDFNVMLNNVTSSRLSLTRQGIEYIIGNTGSLSSKTILTPVQLQDSYQSLTSFNNSRYEGSKVSSLDYNNYNGIKYRFDGSVAYNGDNSFGKTAAIDKYVRKIGLFTQVQPNIFLNQRNDVSIKYLVDEFGGLTELNQRNKHWEEVQNTFIAGDTASISLFDNQKFSNQRSTDGEKITFNSGYTYEPVFYFLSASNANSADVARQDKTASFDYLGTTINQVFSVIPNGGSIKIAGGDYNLTSSAGLRPLPGVPSNYIAYDLFNLNSPYKAGEYNDNVYNNGTLEPRASHYKVPSANKYSFTADFSIKVKYATTNKTFNASFRMRSLSNPATTISEPVSQTFVSNTYHSLLTYRRVQDGSRQFLQPDLGRSSFVATNNIRVNNGINSSYTIFANSSFPITFQPYVLTRIFGGPTRGGLEFGGSEFVESTELLWKQQNTEQYFFSDDGQGNFPGLTGVNEGILNFRTSINNIPLIKDDEIFFEFLILDSSFTSEVPEITMLPGGSLRVDLNGGIPTAFSSFVSFDNQNNTINLTGVGGRLANIYGPNFIFLPTGSSFTTSSLYSQYGPVNYPFELNVGDIILLTQSSGSIANEYIINSIDQAIDAGKQVIRFGVFPPFPANIGATLFSSIFLKKVKDETNIISKFRKATGNTSYGFIIPENLHPDVLANIDTITKEVKQKLLADQQGNVIG